MIKRLRFLWWRFASGKSYKAGYLDGLQTALIQFGEAATGKRRVVKYDKDGRPFL